MAISGYHPMCTVALRYHVTDTHFLKGCCKTRYWILCKLMIRGFNQAIFDQLSSRTPVSSGLLAFFFKIISASSFTKMSFSTDKKMPHLLLYSIA